MADVARPHIERSQLVERALAIIDADGLEALSMRRLAREFGIKAPSLYNHVSSKDELIDGALELMRSEMILPDDMPDDWMGALEVIFGEYRRLLAAHPNMVTLAGRRVPAENDSGLEFLRRNGFETRVAVELWQALTALVVGYAMFGSGQAATDTSGLSPAFAEEVVVWSDDACREALRFIMEGYATRRQPASSSSNAAG